MQHQKLLNQKQLIRIDKQVQQLLINKQRRLLQTRLLQIQRLQRKIACQNLLKDRER